MGHLVEGVQLRDRGFYQPFMIDSISPFQLALYGPARIQTAGIPIALVIIRALHVRALVRHQVAHPRLDLLQRPVLALGVQGALPAALLPGPSTHGGRVLRRRCRSPRGRAPRREGEESRDLRFW